MRKITKSLALIFAVMLLVTSFPVAGFSQSGGEIKNVIYMIGDGMGPNHLEWTKAEKDVELFMDTMPCQGYSQSDSLSGLTDSAAGGTALSCAKKVYNSNLGTVSITAFNQGVVMVNLLNIREAASSLGKRTGILTSDVCSGATPASFSAHTAKRQNTEIITEQELACDADLFWACSNGLVTKEDVEKTGRTYVSTSEEVNALENGEKSFGVFTGKLCYDSGDENDIPLSALTASAIENLDCEEGFFLMVEGAHIDKYSHSNEAEGMMLSLIEFDKAVEVACDFAEKDGHTAVVVTADHETGGITFDKETQTYSFTSTGHTRADVPLRVYGVSDFIANGETVEHADIPLYLVRKLGYTKKFPYVTHNLRFVPDFFAQFIPWLKGEIEDLFNK